MKKLLILLICLVTFYNVKAQNPAYANRMQHIFGNIDKTKVTTGNSTQSFTYIYSS